MKREHFNKKPSIRKALRRLGLIFIPLPRNTFCSIDVTSSCNLRCKHCYHFAHEQSDQRDLTVDEWIERVKDIQAKHAFFSCTWVGGEPLLRKEIIDRGKGLFRHNIVVTNGTIPLPNWQDVDFHISLDGTETIHNAIRGEGCYEKIKNTVSSPHCKYLKIALACCINRMNKDCLEDLLAEWYAVPTISHVLFDFMTPVVGADDTLWLSLEERDEILEQLNDLKKRYGDFIGVPPATFDLMRSDCAHKSVGRNCVFVKNGMAFDARGNRKYPCVMGQNADCARCGCVVPFSIKAWKKPGNLLREAFDNLRMREHA